MKLKRIFPHLLASGLCMMAASGLLHSQEPACGFDLMLAKQVLLDPALLKRLSEVDLAIGEAVWARRGKFAARSETVIPVVVHIVWNRPDENLSDERVLSQIAAMNRDFNAENIDLRDVPAEFKPFISKGGIRFCLAAKDPQDLPTSGIIRRKTGIETIGTKVELYSSALGGSDAWDTERYLNIWVANTGNFITGFGTYPGQVEVGKTGVVVHPKYFGENSSKKYSLGRVAVHEAGHYLGLSHIWDGNSNCDRDDGVADTPSQQHPYSGCPVHPQSSCGSTDMFMNFMDYVDDRCMLLFTHGQMERMLVTLDLFRPGLTRSGVACVQTGKDEEMDTRFWIFPNPASTEISITLYDLPFAETGWVVIYNALGQMVFQTKTILHDQMNFQLPFLSSGIYWIRIGKQFRRLVIQ